MSAEENTLAPGVKLLERLADIDAPVLADEEAAKNITALQDRFKAAVVSLRERQFSGADGRPCTVDELPWFVVIGAPGSGNSSAIQNSGLHFPQLLPEGDPQLTGVGGTRYCEWWFAEEAVLLDTAGRYVAHETRAKADIHAGTIAWHRFLKLLKEQRPQQPINGAIVTLNVMDLLLWSKPERQHFSAHVRMRLAELYAGLDARFPVYLVVTKMDLLAGFAEFFDTYDAQARAQVWGTTFEPGADPLGLSRSYGADFEQLMARLYAEMLARLEEESDLARRAAIYRFPQQFHAIGQLMSEFIALAFSTSVDHRSLMLRGVYFTSATQTGKPVDRVMRTLERAFKLRPRESEVAGEGGHGFFLDRLLRDVILPESVLASTGEPAGKSSPPLAH